MYFTVKYIDWRTFDMIKDVDVLIDELTDEVKHAFAAQVKSLSVNPDCFIAIIMDYIFEEAGIDYDIKVNFDLITDRGIRINVHNYPPDFSGQSLFEDRGVYYIAYCPEGETLKPMLSKESPEYLDFVGANRKSSSRKSRNSSISKSSISKGSISKGSQCPSQTSVRRTSLRSNRSTRSSRRQSKRVE